MSSFTKPLDLRFLDLDLEQRPFELLTPFCFYVDDEKTELISVPVGYRTDFASVPRAFHWLINPVGKHGKAAVIHDWLCSDEQPKRYNSQQAADIFDLALKVLKVPAWRRKAMVWAVKQFGPKFDAEK